MKKRKNGPGPFLRKNRSGPNLRKNTQRQENNTSNVFESIAKKIKKGYNGRRKYGKCTKQTTKDER